MVNEGVVEMTLDEWQALEAVVYAARAISEGKESWITIKQALAHLDNIRDIQLENKGPNV
jgi:hypothetical protein